MHAIFKPILAGATLRDRLLASLGGLIGVSFTALCVWMLHPSVPQMLMVAPIGASAVLVFAVPASPLAQPWPVIGGNIISGLIGVCVAHLVPNTALAAGVAVGGAILAMSLLRCLHPPGGASALTAVIGGHAVLSSGYAFPFVVLGLDAALLTLAGMLFHRFSGHSYPHRPALGAAPPLPLPGPRPHPEDLDRALEDLGETLDVSRDDLELLFQRAEHHALVRQRRERRGA